MLVCCDNEGCIVDAKGERFDLPALYDLATDIAAFPAAFTICTGRAVPYVEAMVQVLNLVDATTPCVCEGGGALYIPCKDRCEAIAGRVDCDAIRALLPVGSYREEPGKVSCFTAYPEYGYTVDDLYAYVTAGRLAGLEVNRSIASVDVTPEGVDKMYGVRALLNRVGEDWSSVLAIGDSWNDLPMLRAACRPVLRTRCRRSRQSSATCRRCPRPVAWRIYCAGLLLPSRRFRSTDDAVLAALRSELSQQPYSPAVPQRPDQLGCLVQAGRHLTAQICLPVGRLCWPDRDVPGDPLLVHIRPIPIIIPNILALNNWSHVETIEYMAARKNMKATSS